MNTKIIEMIKDKIIDQITMQGVLPMYITDDFEVMKRTVQLCSEAGLTTLEVLNRIPNSLDIFKQLMQFVKDNIPGFKLIAGTITDVETAYSFIKAGACMIIAPNMDEEIGNVCIDNGIEWLPGVFTISEIYKAKKIGAIGFKLFPANLSSPDFVRTVKTLLPEIKLVASGGIRLKEDTIPNWISSGSDAVAFGNGFFSKDILFDEVYEHYKNEIQNTVKHIHIIRNDYE